MRPDRFIAPRRHLLPVLLGIAFGAAWTGQAGRAEDHFLTIGGGYSPTGNQVSLEKNVQLFQRLVEQRHPDGAAHEIYFSDGDDPGRDLQYHDPDSPTPAVNEALARVFRASRYLDYQYRSHQVEAVTGGASRDNIDRWFREIGSRLRAGDRLFIYVTAHGGRATDKNRPEDTTLYLWNGQRLQMRDLAGQLDTLSPEVPVVLVMVQCYSGGFANVLFRNGDAKQGAVDANRCGFFATVPDRPAAGCTPDIHEENYQEYSSYFWAALSGRARDGRIVEGCDYDGDGGVCLSEAHTYALLESNTIDISVKTSDAFLRAYSSLKPEAAAKTKEMPTAKPAAEPAQAPAANRENPTSEATTSEATSSEAANSEATSNADPANADPASEPTDGAAGEQASDQPLPAGDSQPGASPPQPVWLTASTPYAQLLERASVAERTLLEGLSRQLQLDADDRAQAARQRAAEFQKQMREIDKQLQDKSNQLSQQAKPIQQALIHRWPELANRWHPRVSDIVALEGDQVLQAIESHGSYPRMMQLEGEARQLSQKKLDLDRQWAKTQRLLRALENIALAANLPHAASTEVQQRYAELVEAERAVFLAAPQPPASQPSADESSAVKASANETPANETSANETPANETPANETPADQPPASEPPAS